METTAIIAVYGAVVGTISLLATSAFKAIELRRDRSRVSVDWFWARTQSAGFPVIQEVQIQAWNHGRRPVMVSSAGISLREGALKRKPWQRPHRMSVLFVKGTTGVRSDLPAVLNESHPTASAYMELDLVRSELKKAAATPFGVWVDTGSGRKEKRIAKNLVSALMEVK